MNNGIEMLNDTLSIFEKGYYYIENKKVKIKLTRDEQENVRVFLPNEINELENYRFDKKFFSADKCVYGCENMLIADEYVDNKSKKWINADTFSCFCVFYTKTGRCFLHEN